MKARRPPTSSSPRNSPRSSHSPPPLRARPLGCLHACIALVAVLAGVLLALGVNERVNGGGMSMGDGDAPPLGSGQ
jgi:hypothetical protein